MIMKLKENFLSEEHLQLVEKPSPNYQEKSLVLAILTVVGIFIETMKEDTIDIPGSVLLRAFTDFWASNSVISMSDSFQDRDTLTKLAKNFPKAFNDYVFPVLPKYPECMSACIILSNKVGWDHRAKTAALPFLNEENRHAFCVQQLQRE